MGRYANFPDIFYVICMWDDEGINFETIDATVNEEVAQEQVMAHTFQDSYEKSMAEYHAGVTPIAGKWLAEMAYKTAIHCPRFFYKTIDLR